MVNMFSGSMVPMGMGNMQNNVNVHQNLKAKYGVGYEDFGSRPYAQPYPMAIVPRRPDNGMGASWFGRFIRKCFLS